MLTGILRVAKESLFSGLNNFTSSAGLELDDFCDKLGFTEAEVAALLAHNDLNGREMEDVRAWYDGYRYGGTPIYNPWPILQYAFAKAPALKPHWVNTGGHDLLKRLFSGREADIKPSLEMLMRGEALRAPINEYLTFRELEYDAAAILSLLFFAGYLRAENAAMEGYETSYDIAVPNHEVMFAYHHTVSAWLKSDLSETFNDPLLEALTTGDVPAFGELLGDFVLRVFSYFDTGKRQAEHFYHAFLLGLIARLDSRYRIRSNAESGLGRYDICLIPRDASQQGIVMEIKAPRLGRKETLEQCLEAAREQLEAKKYDTELADSGVADVLRLAIAVAGKELLVEAVGES